jgi:tetratricopeptide (TPR) repeat protein
MDEIFDGMSIFEADGVSATATQTAEPQQGLEQGSSKRSGGGRVRMPLAIVVILVFVGVPGSLLISRLTGGSDTGHAADAVAQGLAAHRAARIPEATALYQEALRLDSRNKFAHYNLGLIAQTSGDRAAAEREYRIALALDERFATALFNLAIVRSEAGALDEAAELYRRLIAIEPRNAGAHLNLGFVLIQKGARAEAKTEFSEALRLEPKLAERVPKDSR